MPCNLRTAQGGWWSLPIHPTRGNAVTTNAHQPAPGPEIARKSPLGHAQTAKQTGHWKRDCPQSGRRNGVPTPEVAILTDWGGPGILVAPPNQMPILMEEPHGVLDMAAKKVNFLIDTEATYSVLIFHTGSLSSKSCTVTGVNGKSYTHFTGHLTCQF